MSIFLEMATNVVVSQLEKYWVLLTGVISTNSDLHYFQKLIFWEIVTVALSLFYIISINSIAGIIISVAVSKTVIGLLSIFL